MVQLENLMLLFNPKLKVSYRESFPRTTAAFLLASLAGVVTLAQQAFSLVIHLVINIRVLWKRPPPHHPLYQDFSEISLEVNIIPVIIKKHLGRNKQVDWLKPVSGAETNMAYSIKVWTCVLGCVYHKVFERRVSWYTSLPSWSVSQERVSRCV